MPQTNYTPQTINASDYTPQTIVATNYQAESLVTGALLLQGGYYILLQNGDRILL